MTLSYLAAAVWFALALLLWVLHPSDVVWLLASAIWAIVFFGLFMWGLARKAEDRQQVPSGIRETDAQQA